MKLYFNGCSHTYGDDLENKNTSWPALVAKKFDADFYNQSCSSNTNQNIVYNTIKHINSSDKFYIAWTYISRFTRIRSDNNHEVHFNANLLHGLYGKHKEYKDYANLHYKFWYNELYEFKIWLQQILVLQNIFKQYKKQYKMIFLVDNHVNGYTSTRQQFQNQVKSLESFDLMSDNMLDQEFAEIQNYINMFDLQNFIDWQNNQIKVTTLKDKFAVGKTKHLLEDGHQYIAEHILSHDTD